MGLNKVCRVSKKEIFDKIVLINTDDYKRIVYFNVSSVEQIGDRIIIRKLDKAGRKIERKFLLPECIQKITVAQNLYSFEYESCADDLVDDMVDDYNLN